MKPVTIRACAAKDKNGWLQTKIFSQPPDPMEDDEYLGMEGDYIEVKDIGLKPGECKRVRLTVEVVE